MSITLSREDIRLAYWENKSLVVRTKHGGLCFTCPNEQQHMVKALRYLGVKVASAPLSKEQQWMKAAFHVVNAKYFSGTIKTPSFKFEPLYRNVDGLYNLDTRTITFCSNVFRNGLDKSPRYALDLMLHESMHAFLHQTGWDLKQGIDPHTEPCWESLCRLLMPALGLPVKSQLTLRELEAFPYGLTHSSYYTDGLAYRKSAYDWR